MGRRAGGARILGRTLPTTAMGLRVLVLSSAPLVVGCASMPLERFEYERAAMGTRFRIVLYARAREAADSAAEAAFARVAALEGELSDYDERSELSRLSGASDSGPTGPIPVSADLFAVLECSQRVAAASGGAFDVTVGPYVRLWRRARRQGEPPGPERLRQVAPSVGFRRLALDRGRRTVRLLAPAMRLDLGGIAKGFALDEALAVLARRGIERALVLGGGDIAVGRPPPGRAGWRIAIVGLEAPEEEIELACAAVATSGDLERYLDFGGKRYSHIVDPRTGRALDERRLVSVIAPGGMLADALATAVSVLGAPEGLALVERFDGARVRVAILAPDGLRVFRSPAFPPALSSLPRPPSAPPVAPEPLR